MKRCAVSCTGKGELFIRYTVASDIAARMKYRGDSLKKAASGSARRLPKIPGGTGGIIALDRQGNVAMPLFHQRHVSRHDHPIGQDMDRDL